jgi:surface polysaccharide O-acyltransferase-like enzyme
MNHPTETKRYDFVDLLKAIAISFVLFYHFLVMDIDFIHNKDFGIYFNYFFNAILSTCVPIFFFVNGGLLLNKSNLDIKQHAKKSVKIILLTILWGIISLVLLSVIKQEYLSFKEIVKSVYYLKQGWTNHLWFFQALFIIYVFYPLLYHSYKTFSKGFYFFAIAIFIFTFLNTFIGQLVKLVSLALDLFVNFNFEYMNYFSDFNAFRGIYGYSIGYFILGGILFKNQALFKNKKAVILSIVLLPISMGLLFLYGVKISESYNEVWDIVWNGYDSIFTLINVVLIFTMSLYYKGKGLVGRLIKIIAKNSLGIYLTHIIVGTIVNPYIPFSGFLGTLLMTITSLFISLVIVLVIKKIPVLKNAVSLQ